MLSIGIVFLLLNVVVLISYLSNSFPRPLSKEEEIECIKKMQDGCQKSKETLIECNLRLVAHIAKKYSCHSFEQEDLISVGAIGLIKGINSFNPSKGTKLATYLSRCIENEILMLLRSSKKMCSEVSIEDSISCDHRGNGICFSDILYQPSEDIEDSLEDKAKFKNLTEKTKDILDKRELEIINLRYGFSEKYLNKELTQKQVAKILGISRSYVSRIEKKAISKLKLAVGVLKD